MSLPINPLAKLISSASQSIASEAADAAAAVKSAGQAALDAKVDMLSGAAGTNLNGFASGISSIGDAAKGAAGDFANVIGGAAGGIGGALSGIGSAVQTSLSGALDSASSALGSLGGSLTGGLSSSLGGLVDSIGGGISQKFNSAAGQVDDILSKLRGKNVPGGAELFPKLGGGSSIELFPNEGNDWRVRINADWNIFSDPLMQRLKDTDGVVWPYTPTVNISTKANYVQIEPTHNNYPFQSYKNSQVEDITITGEFSCETSADAEYWIAATTFFKAATKMFFGQGQYAGNPPIICRLTGYGGSIFNNVPVVVKSFSVDLRDDVDYINCYSGSVTSNTWVPVLSTISVTVSPIYNRERLRKFNLQTYVTGSPDRTEIGFM
jgi:hypothetical protein